MITGPDSYEIIQLREERYELRKENEKLRSDNLRLQKELEEKTREAAKWENSFYSAGKYANYFRKKADE